MSAPGPFATTLCNADRILVALRHAKSSWSTGAPDHDRPLSGRGRRDARAAGHWLAERGVLADLSVVSTSTRTQQTLAGIVAAGAETGEVRSTRAVYDSDSTGLVEIVQELPDTARTVLLVGHHPALEELVRTLARRVGNHDWWASMDVKFPTSAIAIIGFDGNWGDVEPGVGALLDYVVPRGTPKSDSPV